MECPFCGKDKKMTFNPFWFKFSCWSCGASGLISDFVVEMEGINEWEARKLLQNYEETEIEIKASDVDYELIDISSTHELSMPYSFRPLLDGRGKSLGEQAIHRLESRGFDVAKLHAKGFGYCFKSPDKSSFKDYKEFFDNNFTGYIIVPFTALGSTVYYIGRDFVGNELRYKNPPSSLGVGKTGIIYNEDALLTQDKLYITEGWADAETMGEQGTATLGWNLDTIQFKKYVKSSASKFVLIPDIGYDNQGLTYFKHALIMADRFMSVGKKVKVLDLSTYSELGKDANEIGYKNVRHIEKHTPFLDYATIIEQLSA